MPMQSMTYHVPKLRILKTLKIIFHHEVFVSFPSYVRKKRPALKGCLLVWTLIDLLQLYHHIAFVGKDLVFGL